MSQFTSGNAPGFTAATQSEESQVTRSGRGGHDLAATRMVTLDSTTVDAGNTPTTTLRGGNVIALKTSTGKAHLYDPDATDGTQIAIGILEHHQDMLVSGAAADRVTQALVHGLMKESQLLGLDPRARAQLAGKLVSDADLDMPVGVLMHPRGVARHAADYTVTATDNGLLLMATAAATFTLPTAENGLAFRFVQTADANLVIAATGLLVHKGNAAADTVTFSTASEKIGSQVLVECMYTAESTLKWVVTNLGGTTATVA